MDTQIEQLEHALDITIGCQTVRASLRGSCDRPAVYRIHVTCACGNDSHAFLCAACAGLLTAGNAACINCGAPPAVHGTA